MSNQSLIGSRYKKESLIGLGGVSKVYFAIDTFLEKPVALKIAHGGNEPAMEAILSEYKFAVTHNHPGLLSPSALIFDSGLPGFVMPYLRDYRLGHPELRKNGALFSQIRDIEIESLIAEILECASFIHFNGYIYNDFKPANFIFQLVEEAPGRDQIRPILLDFNLISRASLDTSKGGTMEYIAPEVLLGAASTPASDLYSIGATLFELFTGSPPFEAPESSSLIKLITEKGQFSLENIPDRFKLGLEAILQRDINQRPRDARAAADSFQILEQFDSLAKERVGYYLSAGLPAFANELKKAVREYIDGRPDKIFLSLGTDSGFFADLDFITAEYSSPEYQVERLKRDYDQRVRNQILDQLMGDTSAKTGKTLLLIEEPGQLSEEERQKIRALIREPRSVSVIAGGRRWDDYSLPCIKFDPLCGHAPEQAALEVVRTIFKSQDIEFDISALQRASGGDPELIFRHYYESLRTGGADSIHKRDYRIKCGLGKAVENAVQRALRGLECGRKSLLDLLSVWGDTIPLVFLSELTPEQLQYLEPLIISGHLRRDRDSLQFASGDLRDYVYQTLAEKISHDYHRFWAIAVEKILPESDEAAELLALHWGRSSEINKGYRSNLKLGKELFKKSELSRARIFADVSLQLAQKSGGSLSQSLMLLADILKQEGDYQDARARYVELLRFLKRNPDQIMESETLKDLGDLYRSMKKPAKALAYTKRALALFDSIGNEQGVACCHNNIGLCHWVEQKFEPALESFAAAMEINRRISNYQELAKIQSNIGIIKDIMGKTSEVAGFFESALGDASKASDPWLEALIANNLGYFFIRQNELSRARTYLEKALEISRRIGYTESTINALTNLGLCCLRQGDLFASIEYNQDSLQMAESLGNRHLALDAQLYLAEVCILMGNFSLADNVLKGIESDNVYRQNLAFARQADLLRSRWHHSVGNFADARHLSETARDYASQVGDTRLELDSALSLAIIPSDKSSGDSACQLTTITEKALALGHIDLSDAAGLALARTFIARGDSFNAEGWIERIKSRQTQSRFAYLDSHILWGILQASQKRYDMAIETLSEIETVSASSGFIMIAQEAALTLSEIYLDCGKPSRAREALRRAWSYTQRIVSSLPSDNSAGAYTKLPIFTRLNQANEKVAEKEYLKI
jgi:serine/threonine protein kinase